MSAKSNKRRVSRLFFGRFHGKVLWRSAEEQAWLDMVPVGREFGSSDYERLSILDMYSFGDIPEDDAMHQLGALADAAKGAADRAAVAIHDTMAFIEASIKRIASTESAAAKAAKTAKTVSVIEMNPCKDEP